MSEQVRRKLKAAMQENARLQAEVERLSKVEDKMIEVTYIKGIAGINKGVQS